MADMTRLRHQAILRQASGYIELGELLVENDQPVPPPSATLLRRAVELLATLEEPARTEPVALLLRGEALRALGRWDESLEAMRGAAEREPERLEAWLGMGWCLKRLDRLDEAIEALRHGLEAAPEQAILHYNLACYLSLSGDAAASVEHLARAIALDGRYRDLTKAERDFDPIRRDPRFQAATHLAV